MAKRSITQQGTQFCGIDVSAVTLAVAFQQETQTI